MKNKSSRNQRKSNTPPYGGYNRNQLMSQSEIDVAMNISGFFDKVGFFGSLYSHENKDTETNPYIVRFKLVTCREGVFVTKDEFMRETTRLYSLMKTEISKRIH